MDLYYKEMCTSVSSDKGLVLWFYIFLASMCIDQIHLIYFFRVSFLVFLIIYVQKFNSGTYTFSVFKVF